MTAELQSQLQTILSAIKFETRQKDYSVPAGKALPEPLEVTLTSGLEPTKPVQLKIFPVIFSFTHGEGKLIPLTRTDNSGKARTTVTQFTSPDKTFKITATPSLESIWGKDSLSILQKQFMKKLKSPSLQFSISIRSLSAYITSIETNLGKPLSPLMLEPVLKEELARFGYVFVDKKNDADMHIAIKAKSRQGNSAYGLFFSYVDYNVSIKNSKENKEIFKTSATDIKGGQLDFKQAGLKAFEKAREKLRNKTINEIKAAIAGN
ncbi:MAG: hypothetical protein HQK83_18125 [Fibrobacteria bacterium]|nr:hypothetical protein [Fibrobacteria bacterium]